MGIGLKNRLAVARRRFRTYLLILHIWRGASGGIILKAISVPAPPPAGGSLDPDRSRTLNHTEADVQRWHTGRELGCWERKWHSDRFRRRGTANSPVFASTESWRRWFFAPSAKLCCQEAAACDMSRLTSDGRLTLIYIAQQYLNKLLTPTDCQILGNLYSNLGFSENCWNT